MLTAFLCLTLAVLCLSRLFAAGEATLSYREGEVHFDAAGALASGEIIQLSDGRGAVVEGLTARVTNDPTVVATEGVFDVKSASATTFAKGEAVWWDQSADLAVEFAGADITDGDFCLGPALIAKVNGDLTVKTDLNATCVEASADMGLLVDSTGGTKALTFAAITAGGVYAQADIVAIKNALSQLVATINEMRKAQMNNRISKGGA